MAEVRIVTRDEMLDEIKGILTNEHMTLEEFVAEGQADTLTDGFRRELWLHDRDWIIEPISRPLTIRPLEGSH